MKRYISLILCLTMVLCMFFTTISTVAAASQSENSFSYELQSNEKEYGVKISKLENVDVVFPSTYKGLPVTTINSGSNGGSAVESIYIPDSIVTIDDGAFKDFKALKKVSGAVNLQKIGRNAFSNCVKLTEVDLGLKVSSIGKDAFKNVPVKSEYDYSNLVIVDNYLIKGTAKENEATLIIPEGIIGIADYALEGAFQMSDMVQGAKTVVLPESLRYIGAYAFFETWGMTDIQLPSKLLSIGEYAFSFNGGLKNVKIPASVKTIGVGAFSDCSSIAVTMDADNKYFKIVDNVLFKKDGKVIYDSYGVNKSNYTVPSGVVKIADKAFYGSYITGVTISSTVKTICESAFENCKNLKTVVLGASVTTVGERAFSGCSKLTTLTIQKGCKTIGDRMFSGCTSLKTVSLPSGVTSVGNYAFGDCSKLSKISLPSTITNIGSNAFYNTYYLNNAKYTNGILYCGTNVISTKVSGLSSTITIKEGTTYIASYTFGGLTVSGSTSITITGDTKVKNIVLPASLKYIGMYAFSDFYGITSVTIPAGVKSIGEGAFGNCKKLKTITIKGGTTEIGNRAFVNGTTANNASVTICALKGSKTHSYATQNGFKFKSIGVHLVAPKLTATANVNSGVNIKWNTVKYAEGYRVYRKAAGETSWTKLADVTGLSYTDKSVKNGKQYTYTVRAFNGKTFGSYDKVGITQSFISTPKISKIQNGASGIKIDWSKVSGVDGYVVYRKTSGGWVKLAKIKGASNVSYYDKDVKAGTTYTYTVKAYDASLVSGYNTTGTVIKRLLTPQLLSVTSSKSGVTIKWGKVTGAGGYNVYRKTGNGSWERIATITGGTKVSFLDKTAKKGVTYSYTVKAVSGKYSSSHNANGLSIKDKY